MFIEQFFSNYFCNDLKWIFNVTWSWPINSKKSPWSRKAFRKTATHIHFKNSKKKIRSWIAVTKSAVIADELHRRVPPRNIFVNFSSATSFSYHVNVVISSLVLSTRDLAQISIRDRIELCEMNFRTWFFILRVTFVMEISNQFYWTWVVHWDWLIFCQGKLSDFFKSFLGLFYDVYE